MNDASQTYAHAMIDAFERDASLQEPTRLRERIHALEWLEEWLDEPRDDESLRPRARSLHARLVEPFLQPFQRADAFSQLHGLNQRGIAFERIDHRVGVSQGHIIHGVRILPRAGLEPKHSARVGHEVAREWIGQRG